MAEVVEFRVEQGVEFLDELLKSGIFEENEVKLIVKKRKNFEYKLQRRKKSKVLYLKYIAYEQCLLKLIVKRRERIGFYSNYKEIEFAVCKKIKWLYRKATEKYQSDVDLWFSFINFCKEFKLVEDVSQIYSKMLQLHNCNDAVWVSAAKWHFEENNSPDVARELLLRGLRHVPESKALWTEYFRMELMYISLVEKRMSVLESGGSKPKKKRVDSVLEASNDSVIEGKVAIAVLENAVKMRPDDIELVLSFLKVLDDFGSSLRLKMKDHIYAILKERFANKEETFDALARMYLDKAYLKRFVGDKSLLNEANVKQIRRDKMKEVFEEAVSSLETEKMWTFYIKLFLELLSESNEDNTLVREVQSLMQRAWNQNLLNFSLFNEWMLLLNENNEDLKMLIDLIQKGTHKWCSNATVWYTCLSVLTNKDASFKLELKKLFARAVKHLETFVDSNVDNETEGYTVTSKNVLDIWNLYIEWATVSLTPAELFSIIDKASVCSSASGSNLIRNREVAAFLKPKLLEKCSQFPEKGIAKARFYYEKYKDTHPVIQSFFETMLEMEMNESNMIRSRVRKVFNDYIEHFGSNDHQIWLKFIKFELENKNPEAVSNLYYSACKQLNSEESDNFITAYSLLRTESCDD